MSTSWLGIAGLFAFLCAGCNTQHRVTVDPVEFKPIHVTMDVNVKIQRELDEFFDFEETIETEEANASDETPSNGEGQ